MSQDAAPDGPVVIFLHIAKTAGSSVSRILEYAYEGAVFPAHFSDHVSGTGMVLPQHAAQKFFELSPADRARVRLIEGHLRYGLHEQLDLPAKYLTITRDPPSRMVSGYNYAIQMGWLTAETSFADFLRVPGLGRDNQMVRHLHGDPALDSAKKPAQLDDARPVTQQDLDAVIGRIEDGTITAIPFGRLEYGLYRFLRRERRPISAMISDRRRNLTSVTEAAVQTLTGEELDLIHERNSYDAQLHAHVAAQPIYAEMESDARGWKQVELLRALTEVYGLATVGEPLDRKEALRAELASLYDREMAPGD